MIAFTTDNTEGYSAAELAALNAELADRLTGIEMDHLREEIAKSFADEVAARDSTLPAFDQGKIAGEHDAPCAPPAWLSEDDQLSWKHGWSDGRGNGDNDEDEG
jgi:hypothetical protein